MSKNIIDILLDTFPIGTHIYGSFVKLLGIDIEYHEKKNLIIMTFKKLLNFLNLDRILIYHYVHHIIK